MVGPRDTKFDPIQDGYQDGIKSIVDSVYTNGAASPLGTERVKTTVVLPNIEFLKGVTTNVKTIKGLCKRIEQSANGMLKSRNGGWKARFNDWYDDAKWYGHPLPGWLAKKRPSDEVYYTDSISVSAEQLNPTLDPHENYYEFTITRIPGDRTEEITRAVLEKEKEERIKQAAWRKKEQRRNGRLCMYLLFVLFCIVTPHAMIWVDAYINPEAYTEKGSILNHTWQMSNETTHTLFGSVKAYQYACGLLGLGLISVILPAALGFLYLLCQSDF